LSASLWIAAVIPWLISQVHFRSSENHAPSDHW